MSLIYYFLLIGIFFLIIEVISILFKTTGLDIEKSRFQTISMITHTGFTTRESELISQHPLRRKIASYLMIFSYVGQAGFISIFLNMLKEKQAGNLIVVLTVLVAVGIFFIRNSNIVSSIDNFVEKTISKQMKRNKKSKTIDEVLKLNEEYGVGEIIINGNNPLCGVSLKESNLRKNNIQVLNVDRGSEIIQFPSANLVFQTADKIIVYGKIDSIKELLIQQYTEDDQ